MNGTDEYLLEEHRKDMKRDVAQIHLAQKALRGRVFQPSLFTRSMENLGKWLISRGETLVKRYETPKKRSPHKSQNTYAH